MKYQTLNSHHINNKKYLHDVTCTYMMLHDVTCTYMYLHVLAFSFPIPEVIPLSSVQQFCLR